MMKRLLLPALALSATLAAPAAFGCDQHGSADNYFLAYIDFRDMTESEQRAAEQRAIDQFHAQQLQTARAQFMRRFTPDPTPPPAQGGAGGQQTL